MKKSALAQWMALFFLTGCTSNPVGTGESETMTLISSGGTWFFPSEGPTTYIELDVPPSAVPEDTEITITMGDAAPWPHAASTPVYHFEPDGLSFEESITVRFVGEEQVSFAGISPGDVVYWTSEASAFGFGFDFEQLPSNTASEFGDPVSATVSHFSSGFVGSPTSDTPDGSAGKFTCRSGDFCIEYTVPDATTAESMKAECGETLEPANTTCDRQAGAACFFQKPNMDMCVVTFNPPSNHDEVCESGEEPGTAGGC